MKFYHPMYRYRGTGEIRKTGTWWVTYYEAGKRIRRRATQEEIRENHKMDLQPIIDELITRRELMKQELKDIEDAIPALQRLNNKMSPPKVFLKEPSLEPVVLEKPEITPEIKPQKAETCILYRGKSTSNSFVCEICHCTFKTEQGLKSHNDLMHSDIKGSTGSLTGRHRCLVCSKKFHTGKGLKEHTELRHPKEEEEENENIN